MAGSKTLTEPRRCHNNVDGLGSYTNRPEKYCPNYVNMKKARKKYWQRFIGATGKDADRMCWAYVCDWCWQDLNEIDDWDGWPTDDSGKFMQTVECNL